jgi:hypothetical protein
LPASAGKKCLLSASSIGTNRLPISGITRCKNCHSFCQHFWSPTYVVWGYFLPAWERSLIDVSKLNTLPLTYSSQLLWDPTKPPRYRDPVVILKLRSRKFCVLVGLRVKESRRLRSQQKLRSSIVINLDETMN